MTTNRITACRPTVNLLNINQPFYHPSMQCRLRNHSMLFSGPSLKFTIKTSPCQKFRPMCLFGDKGKQKPSDNNEQSSRKNIENSFGSLKKEKSVEELLREQISKQEYYDDDGGNMDNPPIGGGGGGGGNYGKGNNSSEPEDESAAEGLDEILQGIFATSAFIFVYIYIIHGEELTLLARDWLRYMFGGNMSVRLRQTIDGWKDLWYECTVIEEEEDPYWLEKAIITTTTWWDSPEKYQRIIENYEKDKNSQSSSKP